MISFRVDDMTCGHCVGAITQAVKQVDPAADLQVDLASHRVGISGTSATAAAFCAAMAEAGYTPVELASVGAGEAGFPGRTAGDHVGPARRPGQRAAAPVAAAGLGHHTGHADRCGEGVDAVVHHVGLGRDHGERLGVDRRRLGGGLDGLRGRSGVFAVREAAGAQGVALQRSLKAQGKRLATLAVDGLSADEQAQLQALLLRLKRNLEAAG